MMPRCFYRNCKEVGECSGIGVIDHDSTEVAGKPIFDSVYLCKKHKAEIYKMLEVEND